MTLVSGLYVKNIKRNGIGRDRPQCPARSVLIRPCRWRRPRTACMGSPPTPSTGSARSSASASPSSARTGPCSRGIRSSRISLNDLDNHADRQKAALRGFGVSIRHSNTLDTDLVYAAIPFAAVGKLPDGFIRVAVPLKHVEERIAQSERQWLAIVGLATLIALLFAYGLSTHLERSLKEMIRVVESIATDPAGQGNRRRLHILPGREFRQLAHAVNDMTDRTEEHLRTPSPENKARLKTIPRRDERGLCSSSAKKGASGWSTPPSCACSPPGRGRQIPRGSHPGGGNPSRRSTNCFPRRRKPGSSRWKWEART